MNMKKIHENCENCGGNEYIMKQDIYECCYCKTKYKVPNKCETKTISFTLIPIKDY